MNAASVREIDGQGVDVIRPFELRYELRTHLQRDQSGGTQVWRGVLKFRALFGATSCSEVPRCRSPNYGQRPRFAAKKRLGSGLCAVSACSSSSTWRQAPHSSREWFWATSSVMDCASSPKRELGLVGCYTTVPRVEDKDLVPRCKWETALSRRSTAKARSLGGRLKGSRIKFSRVPADPNRGPAARRSWYDSAAVTSAVLIGSPRLAHSERPPGGT